MKAQPVVNRDELVELQTEIRELEASIDRPLPPGTKALRVPGGVDNERTGRAPVHVSHERPSRRCPFGDCDGSGWHLHDVEDVASPCKCQKLPRDTSARHQTSRILRRHLALSLDVPPLTELGPSCIEALREYSDLSRSVAVGRGLWLAGFGAEAESACAFLAGEALRREIPVLLYPADELIGRLRRLAGEGSARAGVEEEIYERLAQVDLLMIDGLDAAAALSRYPEQPPPPESFLEMQAAKEGKHVPYEPGMNETDLSRLFQILDERLMNERATVLTTQGDIAALEESLVRVPGEWPSRKDPSDGRGGVWHEAQRRASNLQRLISRMIALCGNPIGPPQRDISVYREASDRNPMLAG